MVIGVLITGEQEQRDEYGREKFLSGFTNERQLSFGRQNNKTYDFVKMISSRASIQIDICSGIISKVTRIDTSKTGTAIGTLQITAVSTLSLLGDTMTTRKLPIKFKLTAEDSIRIVGEKYLVIQFPGYLRLLTPGHRGYEIKKPRNQVEAGILVGMESASLGRIAENRTFPCRSCSLPPLKALRPATRFKAGS